MIALEQARSYLEQLGLAEAALVLESRLEAAAHKDLAYAEFLADLLHAGGIVAERGEQDQRVLKNSLTVVHTPTIPYGIVFCQDLGKER